ncbi:unannotated protein [freshwater metagenome]|uniref:Unannotated protein n=1 Tax=freshwater metagenome TaxID=449393 RepID=A0A6J7NSD7_9ZZZZ
MHGEFDGFVGDGSACEGRTPLERLFLFGEVTTLAAMDHGEVMFVDEHGGIGTDL